MTYEPLEKKCLLPSRELIIVLNLFETAIHGPPWPDLQKKNHVKKGRFDKKIIFLPYKNLYRKKN